MPRKFIIEGAFNVPLLIRYCVEAESAEAAIQKFKEREASDRDFWDAQFQDFDCAGPVEYADVTDEYADLDGYDPGDRADAGA